MATEKLKINYMPKK